MSTNFPASTGNLPSTVQPLIVELSSPLDPNVESYEQVEPGTSVAEHLKRYDLHSAPKLVIFNTEPLLEADWEDTVLNMGDQLTIVNEPGFDPITWALIGAAIFSVLVAGYAIYTILTMDTPDPGDAGDSPNYSVRYRGNQRRPGAPIPVVYGEMKVFPDYSGKYSRYSGNDQWLYQIFDITLGEIEPITAAELFYEDTPLTAFDEYEIEHIEPGQISTIFPSEVHISTEVSGIEITQGQTWTINYVVNPPATTVTRLEFDWAMPNGLYHVDDKGRRKGRNDRIWCSWREIDDAGTPIGSWQETSKKFGDGAYKYPFRRTMSIAVPAGRYEARFKRSRTKSTKLNDSQELHWTGLRGFSPDATTTETTRLAIKIRASERLGNASLSKLSLVAKRKIPIWNGSAWSQPAHTRLAAWAFADVCRAAYGAKLADSYIDLDTLLELAGTGVEWNGVFDNKGTVWSALNEIARPFNGRAIQRPGGIYTIKRDLPSQIPKMMFTMRNIVRDTFGINHALPVSENINFVRVTYKNKLEDYRETVVDCVPTGITPIDPYEVRLRGVTDEQHAYDIGIRMARENLYRRKRIVFETGLEGLVVEYMDTVLVSHWQLGLEQTIPSISGEIASDVGYTTLTVYEDLTGILSEPNPKVFLMDTDGSPFGPISCTVPDKNTIVLDTPGPESIFTYSDSHAGPRFCIGSANDFMLEAKVTAMQQVGEHRIRIECVEDDQAVYDISTPPGYTPIGPPENAVPTVTDLMAAIYGNDDALYVNVTWQGQNADYYIVDMSEDSGLEYEEMDRPTVTATSFNIPIVNPLYIRVRGVNLFVGQPAVVIINPIDRTVTYPGVYNLRPLYPFNSDKVGVQWNQLPVNERARIKFIHNSTVVKQIDVDHTVSFAEITDDEVMAMLSTTVLGQPFPASGTRFSTVQMHGLNTDGDGNLVEDTNYTQLLQTNDPMGDLQELQVTIVGTTLNVDFVWPEPHGGFVFVFASLTPAFTASEANLIHFGDSNTFSIVNKLIHPGAGSSNTYYIQIAGCDTWGPDNLSIMPEFSVETEDTWPPITEEMLDPSLGDRIDLIDRDPADPGGLVGLVNVNITNISNNRTDIDAIEGRFSGGVLQVPYGGTGVTTATGTGSTVRSDSPTFTGNVNAPTPASLSENSTIIATTAWVQSQGYSQDPGLGDLPGRVDTLESHFGSTEPWVLEIVHGGTGATTATGAGSVVLATSPHLTAPTADNPIQAENSTRIATTSWVKSQGYSSDPQLSDLPDRVDMLESHFGGVGPWVLEVVHGGTGVTTSTGSGSVVLSNNPTVSLASGSTAVTQLTTDNDTSIATTAWVKLLGYADAGDLTALTTRVTTNEGDISTLQGEMDVVEGDIANLQPRMTTAEGDIDTLEGYFTGGVLQVLHGGTGVTASTGTGKTVLSNSPTFTGNPIAPTPALSDNDTSIATTAFVKGQGYATDGDLTTLEGRVTTNEGDISNLQGRMTTAEGDIDTLEGYFVAGVLPVIHGGTGVTVSTGTGEVVLSNSPDLDGTPTSTTPTTSDSSTKIATTAFVKNQGYGKATDITALENRVTVNEGDIDTLESYFTGGVLEVLHGGTGVTDSTGSGTRFVLQNSPTIYLGGSSTTPTRPLGDSTTRVASTAFVQQEISDQSFDPSGLQSQIDTNRTDLDVIEGHFVGGVLEVVHGGTGVTTSTGSGSVVRASSPTLTGNPKAPNPPAADSDTSIATTQWVQGEITSSAFDPSGLQSQIDTNRTDLDVIESHFVGGVLQVEHGGTGVTAATGSGTKFVLQSSPDLQGNPTAPTQATSNSSTRIANTAFVHNLLNEGTQNFPVYMTQTSKTLTTSFADMGTRIYIIPSRTDSLFRASFCFHGYPNTNTWYRARMYCNGSYPDEYLMSREWSGGYFTTEGQSKTYYFASDGTLNAQEFYLRAKVDGGSKALIATVEVQEVSYIAP